MPPVSLCPWKTQEEYELKLALTPEQVERLSRSPLLRELTRDRAATQRLFSTYFDTPSRCLRAHDMALRVRRIGRRRVQTLKIPANGSTGLQHFKEFEVDIKGEHPELSSIKEKGLRAFFKREKLSEQVEPVFVTDFARRRLRLEFAETTIELAMDRGEIRSGGRTLPICETELELISGRPSRLYELALALQESVPFRLESRTKARRGYDLATSFVPPPVYGERPALAPDVSMRDAILTIARACRDHFRANEPAVLGGTDPEGVHQMRVGVRRLRALLHAVRGLLPQVRFEPLARELGWLQRELGPARDWDVFIADCLEPLAASQHGDGGLANLLVDACALRHAAYEQARAALGTSRYARMVLQLNLFLAEDLISATDTSQAKATLLAAPGAARPWLGDAVPCAACATPAKQNRKRRKSAPSQRQQDTTGLPSGISLSEPVSRPPARMADPHVWPAKELCADNGLLPILAPDACLDGPARAFAENLFAERDRKLRKRGRNHQDFDEAKLHRLRIEAKKLRYAFEFFGDLFEGKVTAKAIKALSSIQDALGGLNDAAIGRRLLHELTRRDPEGAAPEIAHAAGLVTGWQASRLSEGRSHFDRYWKHYKELAWV